MKIELKEIDEPLFFLCGFRMKNLLIQFRADIETRLTNLVNQITTSISMRKGVEIVRASASNSARYVDLVPGELPNWREALQHNQHAVSYTHLTLPTIYSV